MTLVLIHAMSHIDVYSRLQASVRRLFDRAIALGHVDLVGADGRCAASIHLGDVMDTSVPTNASEADAAITDVRVDRARLNYVKERLKDLRDERERLLLERDHLRARLESAGYYNAGADKAK